MSKLPTVVIITEGYKDIKQTYDKIEHVILEESPPKIFNQGIDSVNGDIYCCLNKHENFANNQVVERAIRIFIEYPEFAVIYSDYLVNGIRHYYPSHDFKNFQRNDLFINAPFFFKKSDILFNESLTSLYYYDILKRMSQRYVFNHIPEPLFISKQVNQNYSTDFNIINGIRS